MLPNHNGHVITFHLDAFQIKMSERLKLRRKRIGGGASNSASYQPTNRVNKFLSQAIEARSVDREKANHVNLFSLCFRDPEKERQVSSGTDAILKY